MVSRVRPTAGAALTALALLAAACLGLAGCSSGNAGGASAPRTSSTAPPTSTTTATSPSSVAAVSLTPGQQKVMAANARITASLFALTTAGSKVRVASDMSVPRRALADALTAQRTSLAHERAAAYGSAGRNCTLVRSNAAATWSAAARVRSAVASLRVVTARMRVSVTDLRTAMARVNADLAALRSAVAAEPHPPSVLTTTEVQQALTSAASLASTTLTTASATDAKSGASLASAAQMSGSASTISTKAC